MRERVQLTRKGETFDFSETGLRGMDRLNLTSTAQVELVDAAVKEVLREAKLIRRDERIDFLQAVLYVAAERPRLFKLSRLVSVASDSASDIVVW